MSRTFGQWFRFLGAFVVTGVLVSSMCASLGVTKEEVRNEVRRDVDFTVLPVVLPDGTEAALPPDSDAIQGESSLPPESTPNQAAVEPSESASEPMPEPESAPAPEPVLVPAPVPEPAPAPEPVPASEPVAKAGPGTINSISLAESAGGFTLTLRADKGVGDTSYMNLDNPRRLVIDLRDGWKLATRNVVRSTGVVKHIVVGEHPDRLRLVVHFNSPPKKPLVPTFSRSGKTLKVQVALP